MSTTFYNNNSYAETPYGLKLQQTITGSGAMGTAAGSSVIPSNIKRVYAVCIGGGGAGGTTQAPVTITNAVGSGTVVTYTANNTFTVGQNVHIIGITPTAYNLTGVQISTRSATQFTVNNAATGTYVSGGTAQPWNGGAGGGGGGISAGWTYVADSVTVGTGGVGPGTSAVTGANGTHSQYGIVIAGGGSGGGNWSGGAGGGATTSTTSGFNGTPSYTGAPTTGTNVVGYAAGPSQAFGGAGVAGVSSSGGAALNIGNTTNNITGPAGGRGLICGGGGSPGITTGTVSGCAGGTGDLFAGGTGGTGTGTSFGGGGGGAGYRAAGSNASGNAGGNGGDGGGGGGGANNGAAAGNGGNGVVYLYY